MQTLSESRFLEAQTRNGTSDQRYAQHNLSFMLPSISAADFPKRVETALKFLNNVAHAGFKDVEKMSASFVFVEKAKVVSVMGVQWKANQGENYFCAWFSSLGGRFWSASSSAQCCGVPN